jgi:hypothetical protein
MKRTKPYSSPLWNSPAALPILLQFRRRPDDNTLAPWRGRPMRRLPLRRACHRPTSPSSTIPLSLCIDQREECGGIVVVN